MATRTTIMGILNVTPDSFSDGGLYLNCDDALDRAKNMINEGASIIDVGGESTRPGSFPVSEEEQIKRVVPVIKSIRKEFKNITISIDTNKSKVAEAAIGAGANMVNSLGGFSFDYHLAEVVGKRNVPIVLYHIKGESRTMQAGMIVYDNIFTEINDFFETQIKIGKKYGVKKSQYILDPGIGFGKTEMHNLDLIRKFEFFKSWKLPLLVGVSRKSHLGTVLKRNLNLPVPPAPNERLEAALAETAIAVKKGATIIRTHDVFKTVCFLTVLEELI